ncbi:MAG: hypothetical protein U9N73_00950 [Candidatus Auribacterota bacterium]|nr:hypothetical protein [Candidatus Auribacterota bacterium]
MEKFKYKWFEMGDINGFFGMIADSMSILAIIAAILMYGFHFPADVIFLYMIPGTTIGIFFGDMIYTWMAFRLAKKTEMEDVTAMPIGLDAPSSIGITVAVLGPAFLIFKKDGLDPHAAAMMTWYLGMATMIIIGVFKTFTSFFGHWIQKIVPRAGLLGSLAGIGLLLIAFLPVVNIFSLPVVGIIALGLVLYTLVARIHLPWKIPGILAAIVIGTILYHVLGVLGLNPGSYSAPALKLHVAFPLPTLDFVKGFLPALKYISIAIPFALLTVIGGINVTESARVAGDDYKTRSILLTEACSTIIAGLFGGVAQSTPYIGQPAYKRMGARAGYTLLSGLFFGLGGVLGYISFFVALIPAAVLAPILIFVAMDIVSQAFFACPERHSPAVMLAMVPTVGRLISIEFDNTVLIPAQHLKEICMKAGQAIPQTLVMFALGNGFILTGMLWGAFLVEMIDRRLKACSAYLVILGVLSFFGVIHSATIDGRMYLPWTLTETVAREAAYNFTIGYLALALIIYLLSFTRGSKAGIIDEPLGEDDVVADY